MFKDRFWRNRHVKTSSLLQLLHNMIYRYIRRFAGHVRGLRREIHASQCKAQQTMEMEVYSWRGYIGERESRELRNGSRKTNGSRRVYVAI